MDCSKLAAGLVAALCNKRATAGAKGRILLVNFDDIDRTLSEVVENVITKLVLKAGAKAYPFETFDKAMNPTGTFAKGTYQNTWTQSVPLKIFTKNELSKTFVNNLSAGSKIVSLVENKEIGKDGDVRWEAHGWNNGLELNEGSYAGEMTDGVVYDLTIGSSDTAQETTLPKSVFDTDIETTDLMINGLTA